MKPLAGLAVLVALSIPFLFWYQTWFGRHLSDSEITSDLGPAARPRDTQHALTQLATAIENGDKHAQTWYPQIAGLSHHTNGELRSMAVWVMGGDNKSALFHDTLLTALNDSEPLVRRNAALALARFGDNRGRPELLRILQTRDDDQQTWEALRGLYLVGQPEDVAAIERLRQIRSDLPAPIHEQARQTILAIRQRTR